MKFLRALLAGLSVLLSPALAAAQDFPTKPIRLIVPFPPGGPNDIIARVIGQRMSELTKQPVVIDNRGGQAGVLGTDAIAKSNPDGYTIGIVSASALVISPSMEKVPYDVQKDFAPVTLVVTVPEMLVVASNVPANNMDELVALAKAQPGKLNFASAGVGGLPHLAGELLKLTAGIDIVHVPYRGAAPAINDLLGQQVQMTFLDLPVILPHIKAGTLRPIALGAHRRAPTAPDVPTTAEVGMPDLLIENWYGMIAPAKTPETIVAALNRIANEAMADPSVTEKLANQGPPLAGVPPIHVFLCCWAVKTWMPGIAKKFTQSAQKQTAMAGHDELICGHYCPTEVSMPTTKRRSVSQRPPAQVRPPTEQDRHSKQFCIGSRDFDPQQVGY